MNVMLQNFDHHHQFLFFVELIDELSIYLQQVIIDVLLILIVYVYLFVIDNVEMNLINVELHLIFYQMNIEVVHVFHVVMHDDVHH
jgi:hypothetical protein